MNNHRMLKGAALCLTASVAWGAMFPIAENAFVHVSPTYFSVIRYTLVSILLLVLLWAKEGKSALRLEGRGKALWFYGTMAFTVYNLLVFWGQNQLGTSGVILASVLEAQMPIISVLLFWIFKQRKPQPLTICCMVTAFIGCFLVITKGDVNAFLLSGGGVLPVLLIFAGVAGWVVYTIGGHAFKDWSVLRYSALSCALGTATSLAIVTVLTAFGAVSVPSLQAVFSVGFELGFMVLIAGIAALICWNSGIKILTPINGILFINFVPVTTFIISALQGYRITVHDGIGTLLIVGALIANNLYQRKKAAGPAPGAAG
ncbi:DMT family transporter [Paenibacillus sp. MBLB4367]|uniref:DMT family transporter n=1 Tax=Paenibacillus sp. MBLB4367 TaxID=3384767 RepID=UPI0039084260